MLLVCHLSRVPFCISLMGFAIVGDGEHVLGARKEASSVLWSWAWLAEGMVTEWQGRKEMKWALSKLGS